MQKEQSDKHHRPLSPSISVLLNIIRSGAALVVLIGHLSQSYFSPGRRDLTSLATFAVVVFFLLSGFLIRYVTVRRPSTSAHYYIDRASRIYSVAIPAIAATLLLDFLSHWINRPFYSNWVNTSDHIFLRIFANISFTSEVWNQKVSLLSNSPFWSLSFECFYYVIYGIAFYSRGLKRIVFLVLVSILAGPSILGLLPLWVSGCLLYSLYQRFRGNNRIVGGMTVTVVTLLLSLTVFHRSMGLLLHKSQVLIDKHFVYHAWLGSTSIHFYEEGVIAFLIILFLLLAAEQIPVSAKSRTASAINFIAEGTFPLYLFHFPILVFIFSVIGNSNPSLSLRAMILLGISIFAILIGHPCNILKVRMRAWLLQVFGVKRTHTREGTETMTAR